MKISIYRELVEITACLVDARAQQIRELVNSADDQTSRLLELAANATVEHPVTVELTLKVALDTAVQERHRRGLRRLENDLENR